MIQVATDDPNLAVLQLKSSTHPKRGPPRFAPHGPSVFQKFGWFLGGQFFHPKVFRQNFPTIESLKNRLWVPPTVQTSGGEVSTSAADFWEAEMTSGSSKGLFQMMLGTHHDVSPKSIYFVIVDRTYY